MSREVTDRDDAAVVATATMRSLIGAIDLRRTEIRFRDRAGRERVRSLDTAGRSPDDAERVRLETARSVVYGAFYCGTIEDGSDSATTTNASIEAHLSALQRAVHLDAEWQHGWRVSAIAPDGRVLVVRAGRTAAVPFSDVSAAGAALRPGQEVAIRATRAWNPGDGFFHFFFGDIPEPESGYQTRLYFDVDAEHAPDAIRVVTSTLRRYAIPFHGKCPSHPSYFDRRDSLVLYLADRYVSAACDLMADAWPTLVPLLRGGTPMFALRLAPGLALAESPPNGESFGMHRAQVCAEGLIAASDAPDADGEGRLQHMLEVCKRHELDAAAMHRNAGTGYPYHVETILQASREATSPNASGPSAAPLVVRSSYLDAASVLGAQLHTRAIRLGDRCTWVGLQTQGDEASASDVVMPCGPDVYSGTAGIALFLAALFAETKDEPLRRLAHGAIRHALIERERAGHLGAHGLHSGIGGIALAAMRIGRLTDAESIWHEGDELLRHVMMREPDAQHLDVIAGAAGAISASLHAWRDTAAEVHLEAAFRHGRLLQRAAKWADDAASWDTMPGSARPLTGFAHGASGIASALLELFVASGERTFLEVAEAGMRYERRCFDPLVGNWPDFRSGNPSTGNHGTERWPCGVAWCHGAPGIALTRLHAWSVTRDSVYLDELRVATATTRDYVVRALDVAGADFSLCHGIAGAADILLTIDRSAAAPHVRDQSTAFERPLWERAARHGIASYGGVGAAWPTGAHTHGPTPGLMLGLAGIGHFLLRVATGGAVASMLTTGRANE